MRSCLVLVLAALSFTACAHRAPTSSPGCVLSETERTSLLALDYQAFDQSLPDGGWRGFANRGCFTLARDLIEDYAAAHRGGLAAPQERVLLWHAGQLSAQLEERERAVGSMARAVDPAEKGDETFLWNPYVRGTIAFLRGDRAALGRERELLARGTDPGSHRNLRIIDAFARCFGAAYARAYARDCEPRETRRDQIRSLAVEFGPQGAVPEGLRRYLQERKLIFVGELHGTREIPALFGDLVAALAERGRKTLVGLEISEDAQPAVDAFLRTGDAAALARAEFFSRAYQDGRSSEAMVALLRRLAPLPGVTVLCVDPRSSASSQERDSGMAALIGRRRKEFDRVLTLTGNVHSALNVGTPWDSAFRPMAYELRARALELGEGEIINFRNRHETAEAWVCYENVAANCGVKPDLPHPDDYATAVAADSYALIEDEAVDGHRGSLFIRATRASPPFRRGSANGR